MFVSHIEFHLPFKNKKLFYGSNNSNFIKVLTVQLIFKYNFFFTTFRFVFLFHK